MTLIRDLTSEVLRLVHTETKKKRNRKRVEQIVRYVKTMVLGNVQHYLYAIMAMLILMFLMNCFQFYYYVKLVFAKSTPAEFQQFVSS